jgi:HAD superfamily hydrolase (TIGR01509 family)
MIKAVVFDFDGVIVDSEKIWLNTKINALKKNKIKVKKNINFNLFHGASSEYFFKKIIPKKNYINTITKVVATYNYLLKKDSSRIPALNKKILNILNIKNLKFCIVSNNSINFILKCLKTHNISKYFKKKFIVALKDTKFRKPLPYGYLLILKKLKCKSNEVIVIEDSFWGIKAAKKAKIKYILKYTPFKLKQ